MKIAIVDDMPDEAAQLAGFIDNGVMTVQSHMNVIHIWMEVYLLTTA